MYNVKLLNKIAPVYDGILPASGYCVGADVEAADAIMVRSADMHAMELPESVQCVARAGAGVNNIPSAELARKGVVVFNTPGANANAVKELTVTGLLLSGRNVIGGLAWAQSLKGKGDEVPALVEKGKGQFVGPELQCKTLGVIGLGAIGVQVANVGVALGMTVLGFDPWVSVDSAWRLSRSVKHAGSQDEVLAQADYISVHVPLNKDTRGSINSDRFALMKDGAVLLNFSRGEIVDTDALLAALASGRLMRYVTDFPNDRLLGVENVIAIPHLGASTPESEDNCVRMAAQEIRDYLTTGAIHHSVNYPEMTPPAAFEHRLVVMHANVPNTVGGITNAVSSTGANIEAMVNSSRGEVGCTILDLNTDLAPEVLKGIEHQQQVYRVRMINA